MTDPFREPERTDVYTTRRRALAGEVLLVCAYTERRKFAAARLEGAMPFAELERRLAELPKDAEVVLYCA